MCGFREGLITARVQGLGSEFKLWAYSGLAHNYCQFAGGVPFLACVSIRRQRRPLPLLTFIRFR